MKTYHQQQPAMWTLSMPRFMAGCKMMSSDNQRSSPDIIAIKQQELDNTTTRTFDLAAVGLSATQLRMIYYRTAEEVLLERRRRDLLRAYTYCEDTTAQIKDEEASLPPMPQLDDTTINWMSVAQLHRGDDPAAEMHRLLDEIFADLVAEQQQQAPDAVLGSDGSPSSYSDYNSPPQLGYSQQQQLNYEENNTNDAFHAKSGYNYVSDEIAPSPNYSSSSAYFASVSSAASGRDDDKRPVGANTKKRKRASESDNNKLQQRFSCTHEACDRSFSTYLGMTVHTRVHSPYWYVCDVCGKKVASTAYYAEHMRTHYKYTTFRARV